MKKLRKRSTSPICSGLVQTGSVSFQCQGSREVRSSSSLSGHGLEHELQVVVG